MAEPEKIQPISDLQQLTQLKTQAFEMYRQINQAQAHVVLCNQELEKLLPRIQELEKKLAVKD